MPAAWLIAGLVAAGSVAITEGREIAPNRFILRPAQGLIGVSAAAPLAFVSAQEMSHYLGVSLVCTVATLALCLSCAYFLWRTVRDMQPATAVLSTLAGGASGISTMAPDLDVDHRYVALSQYLRLVIVTFTLPLLLSLTGSGEGSAEWVGTDVTMVSGAILAVLVLGSGYVGKLLRLPAPFLLTPLLLTLVIGVSGSPSLMAEPGELVHQLTYVVIGWQAGGSFSRSAIRAFVRQLPITLAFIAAAIAGCFAMALAVMEWLDVPLGEAYLATTPGGIYAALAVANSTGAGPVVTTMQVVRLVAMLITAIVAAKILSHKQTRSRTGVRHDAERSAEMVASVPRR